MDVKEQIKNSVSIVDVVGRYVSLKPAGKNYKGLCPFHTEKTPSFFVMPEKESYTCFGCNQFGDVFSIIMEMESLTFVEAMNFLIDNYNLNVEKKDFKNRGSLNNYYKINEIALNYFKNNLSKTSEGSEAIKYLKERNINSGSVSEFSLGYAMNTWDGLYKELINKKVDVKLGLDLGLLIKSEKGKVYDRFRGRLMFPIFSESGKIIAFGGRTMFDEASKYMNSPDSPIYKKSEHLYGFHTTKRYLRENKKGILVEGYFDLLALYQGGVKNVAASLGTALTTQQIYLIKRFAENIYVFYDNDKAGEKAAKRAVQMMLEQNLSPFIIKNTSEKDPDDLIRSRGIKEIFNLIETAEDGFKYLLNSVMADHDINNTLGKRRAVSEILAIISKISDQIMKDEYIKKISDAFNISESLLREGNNSTSLNNSNNGSKGAGLLIDPSERITIESIIACPQIISDIRELFNDELKQVLVSRNIIERIFENYDEERQEINFDSIQRNISESERMLFRDIFFSMNKKKKTKNLLKITLKQLLLNCRTRLAAGGLRKLIRELRQLQEIMKKKREMN